MTTAVKLISKLSAAGIKLWLDKEGQLRFKAPKGALTANLKDELVQAKTDVIAFLNEAQQKQTEETIKPYPRHGERRLPLSFSQQRMWFLDRLDPGNPSYHISVALQITGALDTEKLRLAFEQLVARHEALRTTFLFKDNEVSQIIKSPFSWMLDENYDLGMLEAQEQERRIQEIAKEESLRSFDLTDGTDAPYRRIRLMRSRLARLRGGDKNTQCHVLFITMHHIIADGWSTSVLVNELSQLYTALVEERPSTLPPLSIQYADYAQWQRDWMQSKAKEQQLNYWCQQLADVPTLTLPTDFSRPPVFSSRGAVKRFTIDAVLTSQLKNFSQQTGKTLFMLTLAAYNILLARYSGQTDFCVGTPIANRNRAEVESLIGCFINTLALRSDLADNPVFTDYLQDVHRVTVNAYANQNIPFELLVEELETSRDMAFTPVCQVLFTLQTDSPVKKLQLPGVNIENLPLDSHTSKFDILLHLEERGDYLHGEIEYNTDLFHADTITRLLNHYQCLLKSIIANPSQPVFSLSLLPESERQQQLEWNTAPFFAHPTQTIHSQFERQAAARPAHIAVICEQQQITYQALNARANQIARTLQSRGVKTGDYVGLCMERSIDLVAAILGILKAGAAYVPLDPHFPIERLRYILQDSATSVLLTEEAYADWQPDFSGPVICLDRDEKLICEHETNNLNLAVSTTHTAYIIYTSGTTGKPKGCLINHANVSRLFSATDDYFGFGEGDVWTLFHSFAFDFSVWEIWGALLYGGKLVVIPYVLSRSPEEFYQLLLDQQVSVLNQTPSAFSALIAIDQQKKAGNLALRYVIFGGEALDFAALKHWSRQHSIDNPALINMYGITETTVHVTKHKVTETDIAQGRSIIGRPIDDLHIHILDAHGQAAPTGVQGEMFVSGPGVTDGYLHRADLTAERFVANPFLAQLPQEQRAFHQTLYRSGDLARYLPNGDIEYLGRIDHQVKIRGHRIELGEIEAALAQQAHIREAIVQAVETQPGDKRLVAWLLIDKSSAIDLSDVRTQLKSHLPDYMMPSAFLTMLEWPLTGNGKIDKSKLPEPDSGSYIGNEYVAPRNLTEKHLVDIWQEVLQIERIGVFDSFFDLGGHSLLATRLVSQIKNEFGIDLPLRVFFDNPTIDGVSQRLGAGTDIDSAASIAPIEPVDRTQTIPLSFAQERLWVLEQFAPGNAAYNIPAAMRLRGALNRAALEQSLTELVSRHEALRTRIGTDEQGKGKQVIDDSRQFTVQYDMLADSSEVAIIAEVTREANTPFDLQNDCLFRAKLLSLGDEDHLLLITMHHIISDGWSVDILQRELLALYEAHVGDNDAQLPPLPVQYADFAVWQQQWFSENTLQKHLDFWIKALKGAPSVLRLPYDRPRPPVQTFNGAMHRFELDTALVKAASRLSSGQGTTLYTTLLSAFYLLLSRYSHQQDICIGTPVAGRNQPEVQNLIGYFVNSVVVRNTLYGNPSGLELLERVKESTLAAFAHQDIPVERVIDALDLERNLSYPPLAQIGFSFINERLASLKKSFADLQVEYYDRDEVIAKYDLILIVIESDDGSTGYVEYNTDLFDAATIEQMMQHYQRLLGLLIEQSEQAIDTYAMLDEAALYEAVGVDASQYQAILPLTPLQRDLYLNAQMNPVTRSNTIGYQLELNVDLDLNLWHQANEYLANRYLALRTDVFASRLPYGDIAYQCVRKNANLTVELIDLSQRNLDEQAIQENINTIAYRSCNFHSGDLSTYHVFKLADNKFIAIIRCNHMITDGVSLTYHGKTLLELYDHLAAQKPLDALSIEEDRWAAYISKNRLLSDTQEQLNFWRQRLQHCEPLNFSLPQMTLEQASYIHQRHRIFPAHWQAVKKYCFKQRITPALYFKCLYGLMINTYCRAENDFYAVEFSAGRDRDTGASQGCYFLPIPFVFEKDKLTGNQPIGELFAHAKREQDNINNHPYLSPAARSKMTQGGGMTFMFNFYHFFPESVSLQGEEVGYHDIAPQVEGAVQLVVKGEADSAYMDLYYQSDSFAALGFLERLDMLSRQIISGVERLGDLNYITDAEKKQQLQAWNNTDRALPTANSVQKLFEAQVALSPDAIAVVSDEQQLSYQQLNQRANRLAHYLRQSGIGPDTRVGICMHRSVDFMVAVIATIKSGGAYVPIDASYPCERIAYMLQDANVAVLLTQQSIRKDLPEFAGQLICLDAANADIDKQATSNPTDSTDSRDLLYVIYTSGSTGRPKGAAVMHRGELNLLNWYTREFHFNESSRCLVISASGFDLTQKNLFAPLVSGGTLFLPRLERYDSDAISRIIKDQGITIINCAPSAFYQIVEDNRDLSALGTVRFLIFGGEPIRLERLQKWINDPSFNARIVNNYGPTECTDIAAWHVIENPADTTQSVPVGRPNDNVKTFLLNDDKQLLPTGLVGELCITGQGVGRGYLNHDQLNLEKFIPNPFGDGQLYRSGDLMRYRQNGELEFVGRKDFQVKLNGLRIELGEIEHALTQLPGINDVLVTVLEERLVAYLISDEQNPDQSTWPALLKQQLPAYMVPSHFIILKNWPLTPNGKIDRKALPTPDASQHAVAYVEPRNDIEKKLAGILGGVLSLDKVGVHDDFFELGGHSLAASRAIVQIRETFSIDIPLNVLFEMTTIEKLADYIKVTCWASEHNSENNGEPMQNSQASREEGML